MADRARYYLTTAIAYPNNKPGIHTLYEVIGADAIARWHRMLGDDTRFLTGTDDGDGSPCGDVMFRHRADSNRSRPRRSACYHSAPMADRSDRKSVV